MPHFAAPSTDTLASLTSEDLETSSIAVAQAAQKHQSNVLNIPARRESMATAVPSGADFSFVEQPLPTLPTLAEARPQVQPVPREVLPPAVSPRPGTASSSGDATAVPHRPDPQQEHGPSQASRDRIRYFEQQFAYKSHPSAARERAIRDAPVIAELRTNVIITDEYSFSTHLSCHLSTRYQRPESCITVNIQHSACLCLGGSFEPTYLLTISTIPSLLQPVTNKRNTALIQSFMSDTLSVSPDRGVVRFVAIAEENLATNGRTVLSEIEKLEKGHADEKRMPSKGGSRRSLLLRRVKSSEAFQKKNSTKTLANSAPSAPNSRTSPNPPPMPALPTKGLGFSSPSARRSEPEPFDSAGVLIHGQGAVVSTVSCISPTLASPVDSKIGSPNQPSPMQQVDLDHVPASKRQAIQHLPSPPPIPTQDDRGERVKKLGKRKSIVGIFSRK